jgi:hypothetical protein
MRQPGQDAGGEQRGTGGRHGIRAAAGDFMQCAQRQAMRRQMRVQRRHAERQNGVRPSSRAFQQADAAAQGLQRAGGLG